MRYFFLLVIFIFSGDVSAQSISRSAVTNGGASFEAGGYSISCSYGQFAVATYDPGAATLTQGFQQIDVNPCFGDLNFDGVINTGDLVILLGDFGCQGNCIGDLNNDEVVNTADLVAMLAVFGTICP